MCFHLSALNWKVDTRATSSVTAYRLSFSGKKSKWGCLPALLSECKTKWNTSAEILSTGALLSKRATRWLIGTSFLSIRQFQLDRKSTRLNSSHLGISYAVFCLKKKKKKNKETKKYIKKTIQNK